MLWTFISASLIESTRLYEESKGLLLNTTLDELAVLLRLIWRNWIVLLHNFLVVAVVFALFKREAILIFPMIVISRLVYWKTDLRAVVPALVQFGFFLTPVLWIAPESGPGRILLELNPAAWILYVSELLILGTGSPWGYLLRVSLLFCVSLLLAELVIRKNGSMKKRL
jgi:lipopolysaccharide transport system permease protein